MPVTLFLMASFTAPENIGTNPQALLLLIPLVASISIVYKATKVSQIRAGVFITESVLLFGSMMGFILATALVLCVVAWLTTS